MLRCSWDYQAIVPNQAATDPAMSPQNPIYTLRQNFGRSGSDHSSNELGYNGGIGEVRDGTPEKRKEVSQDDLA